MNENDLILYTTEGGECHLVLRELGERRVDSHNTKNADHPIGVLHIEGEGAV